MHMLGKKKGERREMKGGKEGRGKGSEMILFSLVCSVPKKKKKTLRGGKGREMILFSLVSFVPKKTLLVGPTIRTLASLPPSIFYSSTPIHSI